MTDYDKLILEVNTDGRITPDDALKQSAAILRHHLDIFDQITEEQIEFESHSKEVSEEQNRLRNLLGMSVNENRIVRSSRQLFEQREYYDCRRVGNQI